jgi:hypothetical protein
MTDAEEPQVDIPEVPPAEEPTLAESNGAPPDLLWISEGVDTVISTIYIYQDKDTGRLKAVLWEPSPELRLAEMPEFPVETKWSVPTKAQIDGYRDRSSRYNTVARAVLVQRARLEELMIQHHLLEIKLGSEGHQTVVDLPRDKKGVLTPVALTTINKLHPSVIDMMLAKFVDEAALIL